MAVDPEVITVWHEARHACLIAEILNSTASADDSREQGAFKTMNRSGTTTLRKKAVLSDQTDNGQGRQPRSIP